MKTTIDIPDKMLREVMRLEKASTKREVVVKALEELHRRHKLEAIVASFGRSTTFLTNEELERIEMQDGAGRR